jgi:predicted glycoside hydrolase/deacetylase ChbG (UPF0249 family)
VTGKKKIILNLDDVGLLNCINAAAIDLLCETPISSVSVMVTGPWTPGFLKSVCSLERPVDIGVHLCLTCEWPSIRIRPVLGESVPTLLDKDGYLCSGGDRWSGQWDLGEVAREFRAQIALLEKSGVKPTHLDAHMIFYYWRPELLDVLVDVAAENKLPLLVHLTKYIEQCVRLGAMCPAYGNLSNYIFPPGDREEAYKEFLKQFPDDSVSVLALHASLNHPELQAAMGEEGARRIEEFDLFMKPGIFERLGIDVARPGEQRAHELRE